MSRFGPKTVALLSLLAAAFMLGSALTAEYGFGLQPCELCLLQRLPYVVVLVLAAAALLVPMPGRTRLVLLGLVALSFLTDSGIAFYHAGVEQHWWAGPTACTGAPPRPASIEQFQALLTGPPPPRCDQIPWSLFGISMAGYNAMAALVLALATGLAVRQIAGMKR